MPSLQSDSPGLAAAQQQASLAMMGLSGPAAGPPADASANPSAPAYPQSHSQQGPPSSADRTDGEHKTRSCKDGRPPIARCHHASAHGRLLGLFNHPGRARDVTSRPSSSGGWGWWQMWHACSCPVWIIKYIFGPNPGPSSCAPEQSPKYVHSRCCFPTESCSRTVSSSHIGPLSLMLQIPPP